MSPNPTLAEAATANKQLETLATNAGKGAESLGQLGVSAVGTRTDLLFLSFGLLAAGGMLQRVGRAAEEVADDMIGAFEEVQWQGVATATIMGATAEETEALTEEMMRLGKETEFTASQAGMAMRELALAGFSVEEAISTTESALQLATIGFTDVTNAANISVGVMRGFHLETEIAGEQTNALQVMVSELAQAATNSATTVDQLGDALKFTAASAEAVGYNVEEVLASLMVAADNMVRAGIAGRALRRSLVQLAQIASETTTGISSAADVMDEYGLELLDASGEVKGMADVVEELEIKLQGLTKAQRAAALEALFGTRAVTFWAAQMEAGSEELRKRELGLTAAASKEAIFNKYGREGTNILAGWKKQIGDSSVSTEELRVQLGEMGFAAAEADAIIKTITSDVEGWTAAVEDASIASEITAERLRTLHGTNLLLKSSLEMLYAVMGEQLAPLFVMINKLLNELVHWLAQLDKRILAFMGAMILVTYWVGTFFGKVALTLGMLTMMSAAIMVLNTQMEKQAIAAMKAALATDKLTESQLRAAVASASQFSASSLLTVGLKNVARQAYKTAAGVGAVVVVLGKLAVMIGLVTFGMSYAIDKFESGEYAAAALAVALTSLVAVMWAYYTGLLKNIKASAARIAQQMVERGLTRKNIRLKWSDFVATNALTKSKIAATIAQGALNLAMKLSPIFLLIGAITLTTRGWYLMAAALGIAAAAMLYFNMVTKANPIIMIISLIAALVLALLELGKRLGWFAGLFGESGEHSSIFESMAIEAESASRAISGVEGRMKSLSSTAKRATARGLSVRGPNARPVGVAPMAAGMEAGGVKGGRRREASVTINMGGVNIRGPMTQAELRRVVDMSASEALARWDAEYEEGVSE